ncbi:MAG: ribbon-helix-helix protein, CopG family [Planctomycetaceae bacterium]|nr:ribbon-helix-helix protein, CopG family [Planctomycetaceae bacterium]
MSTDSPTPRRGRRVTIDLTPAATEEIDELTKKLGITTADLFRQSLGLFRHYVIAKQAGRKLMIVDDRIQPEKMVQLELALSSPIREEV